MSNGNLNASMRKKMTMKQKRAVTGFLYTLPCLIIIVLMTLEPVMRSVIYAFSEVALPSLDTSFTGLDNFKSVVTRSDFGMIVKNTFVWVIGTVILRVLLGFIAAFIMDGTGIVKGFRLLALLPWTVPSIVSANAWRWILQSDFGLLNGMLEKFGLGFLAHSWLTEASTALPTVLVTYMWSGFPFVMMLFLAGLQSIPEELYESAAIDGANARQKLFKITLPLLRNVMNMVVVLELISAINAFDLLFVLTGGGPGTSSEILGLLIYHLGFTRFDFGAASAASFILIGIALICFVFYLPLQMKKKGK